MKKMYVIISNDIHVMGGEEVYIYGKVKYLKRKGWTVRILFPGNKEGNCQIKYLNEYLSGGMESLSCIPYEIKSDYRNYILDSIIKYLHIDMYDEIIIESHHEVYAFWGELVAEKISGKHFVFCLNEEYRGNGRLYEDNLDFFKFKLDRNELIASQKVINLLFNGYKGIYNAKIDYPLLVMEANPIEDVENDEIKIIPNADYQICSIGRTNKYYLKYAIRGVGIFALNHPDKKINFIIVGDGSRIPSDVFGKQQNINIIQLGILFPIPRKLFDKVDVVIAAAQTAQFTARENVYTIVPNVLNDTTPGVLGYDTLDSWYGGNACEKKYEEVLEDVLINNKYKNKTIKIPVLKTAEYYYELQWRYFELSSDRKEYYTKNININRINRKMAIFPYWSVEKNSNILIYGAGKVGRDYIKQIERTNYCNVIAMIDKNANEYDDLVIWPEEGLLNFEYDTVVIATSSEIYADEMKKNIVKYVTGKKIVYDLKSVNI